MEERTMTLIHNATERARAKHRCFPDSLSKRLAILGEEYGELCAAYNDERWDQFRDELLDVAAVIVRMIEGK